MKKFTLVLAACMIALCSFSQTNSSLEHAKELIRITGTVKISMQVMNNMIASFKKQLPSVPSDFWDEYAKEIDANELVDLIAPIYTKYFSDEELLSLIEFYKTPLGQKVVDKLPLISQDSYKAGEEWGQRISEKIISRLKEKGYTKSL